MSKVTVIAIGTALLLVSVAAAAETYRWVDSDGSVHYGDRPVWGSQEVNVRVPGAEPTPVAENSSGDAADTQVPADEGADEGAQVRAQLCSDAKDRLAKYEKADGIYEEGADGQRRELTLDERVDTILKARTSVTELCEPPPATSELTP
jgi:hypothetical protein